MGSTEAVPGQPPPLKQANESVAQEANESAALEAHPSGLEQEAPAKVADVRLVQELLQGLQGGEVSVNYFLGSLDAEIDAESQRRAMRQRTLTAPSLQLSERRAHRHRDEAGATVTTKCTTCAVLDLQIRALSQSLLGLCTHFTNFALSNAKDADQRSECLNLSLSYIQPFAHLNEEFADACLGLRTAVATVGDPLVVDSTEKRAPVPVKLHIRGAKGLRNADVGSLSDPFCECMVVGKPHLSFKTDVIYDCLDPEWNYTAQCDCEESDVLAFKVLDFDITGHEMLGQAELALSGCLRSGFDGSLELEDPLKTGSSKILVKVEVPSDPKPQAWPPTIESLVDRLMETRSQLVKAEKRAEVAERELRKAPKPAKRGLLG